jgi:hypothetical protein
MESGQDSDKGKNPSLLFSTLYSVMIKGTYVNRDLHKSSRLIKGEFPVSRRWRVLFFFHAIEFFNFIHVCTSCPGYINRDWKHTTYARDMERCEKNH